MEMRLNDELGLKVSLLELYELEVTDPRSDFDSLVAAAEREARAGLGADPGPARALYRRFGMDPTRYRPSSEALLRRVRRGLGLPRVNSLVDVANVVSLRLQIPVGLYDLGQVRGDLTLRMGQPGEEYHGIGKDHVSVAGRICVADDEGACGNPSADSARTMITTQTERAGWLFFLPVTEHHLATTYELVARFARGLMRTRE
jgi:DNA/RNA-binding domain of Phe-tRNA-synthetase-like protein